MKTSASAMRIGRKASPTRQSCPVNLNLEVWKKMQDLECGSRLKEQVEGAERTLKFALHIGTEKSWWDGDLRNPESVAMTSCLSVSFNELAPGCLSQARLE